MTKVLVIHGLRFDSRLTTLQHTLSFARHLEGCEVTYVNGLGLVNHPSATEQYDLVILTYELMSLRNTPFWKEVAKRVRPLIETARARVVMPQDDYSSCSILDDFIVDNQVDHVFSPITRDLEMLYPRSTALGVSFSEALTGYWESGTELPVDEFRKSFESRTVELGQRVRYLPPQLGDSARRKGELAIRFAELAERAGFVCDVSTRNEDVLTGSDWWKFLGNIRFTVGRLGGASIGDPKGRLAMRVHRMQLRRPSITYDEIERRLRTKMLPHGDFSAISPRLFECAAMGVCQVLERAHYFDGFEPDVHYIALEPDMSNIDDVFAKMRDFDLCRSIVEHARDLLIDSGRYSYRRFVRAMVETTTGESLEAEQSEVRIRDLDEELFAGCSVDDVEEVKRRTRNAVLRSWGALGPKLSGLEEIWFEHFRKNELMVESLTIPWCSARQFLYST